MGRAANRRRGLDLAGGYAGVPLGGLRPARVGSGLRWRRRRRRRSGRGNWLRIGNRGRRRCRGCGAYGCNRNRRGQVRVQREETDGQCSANHQEILEDKHGRPWPRAKRGISKLVALGTDLVQLRPPGDQRKPVPGSTPARARSGLARGVGRNLIRPIWHGAPGCCVFGLGIFCGGVPGRTD